MALTKTTVETVQDDWQEVAAQTMVVGAAVDENAEDISNAYRAMIYIEVAPTHTDAQTGVVVIVEVSYDDENWVTWATFTSTPITAGTTIINGSVAAGGTTITLADSSTANFDDPGQKWFIEDDNGSPSFGLQNSESVRTVSDNGSDVVTIAEILERNHATGLSVYDHVDNWAVRLPDASSAVRVLYNNIDATSTVAVTSRISKVTTLS